MKTFFSILAIVVITTFSFGQTRTTLYPVQPPPGSSPFSVPELIEQYLVEKGYQVAHSGEAPVGFGTRSGGDVHSKVLIQTVNLPQDVYQYEVFTFICNNGEGCLGSSGSWVRGEGRYGQDLQWCQINQPHYINNADGTLSIKGYFLNWSHCDKRRGRMFVAYQTKKMAYEALKAEVEGRLDE